VGQRPDTSPRRRARPRQGCVVRTDTAPPQGWRRVIVKVPIARQTRRHDRPTQAATGDDQKPSGHHARVVAGGALTDARPRDCGAYRIPSHHAGDRARPGSWAAAAAHPPRARVQGLGAHASDGRSAKCDEAKSGYACTPNRSAALTYQQLAHIARVAALRSAAAPASIGRLAAFDSRAKPLRTPPARLRGAHVKSSAAPARSVPGRARRRRGVAGASDGRVR
jgi:hypothetical protein